MTEDFRDTLGRRVWLAAVTGIPFGIYKCGLGWLTITRWETPLGWLAIVWGLADIALNILTIAAPHRFEYCVLAAIGRGWDRDRGGLRGVEFGLAVDTLFSFSIVAGLVWFGQLPLEPNWAKTLWSSAVVANVMAVGVERLHAAAGKTNV